MDESLAQHVRLRAKNACEYCRMPQAFYPTGAEKVARKRWQEPIDAPMSFGSCHRSSPGGDRPPSDHHRH